MATAGVELPPFTQAMLDRYLEAHERFVRRHPGGRRALIKYVQAPFLDFKARHLAEADLTGANLERATLARAVFERASFYCANLPGIDARQADFRQVDFRGANLRGANLSGANLDNADLRQALLARADVTDGYRMLRQGDCSEGLEQRFSVDLSNASMKGTKLRNAKLKWANLSGALLQGADLSGADLTGVQLAGAVLTGTKFDRLTIDPAALESCVFDPSEAAIHLAPSLAERIDDNARWVETNGRTGLPAILDNQDLRPLVGLFAGRELAALSAKGVCALGVDFSGAQLQGANFDGADLRDANFTSADLRGASFNGALLWHARFEGADIRALALGDGSAQPFSFKGAQFTAGCFQHSKR
ncbi:MAG: low-complexity protein [Alphaproteobacteria bacterium]|nr:MAG: low-complexity protein [Alphaproteobacteria bacterium]PZO39105.1 MAG: low-complexity protein [Alphaproteobacteria bacterium]